jgi:hypothetical protein
VRSNQIVGTGVGLAKECGEEFVAGLSAIDRFDQRLNNSSRSIESPCIAPTLEEVGGRDVPRSEPGGLVDVEAMVDEEWHTAQGIGNTEIAGSIIGGITTDDDQGFHCTGIDLTDETGKFIDLLGGACLDGFGIDDGAANIPKFSIDSMDKGVDCSRLLITGDDQATTAVGLEIFKEMGEELACGLW